MIISTMQQARYIVNKARLHIWTVEDIQRLPKFGTEREDGAEQGEQGWFYGLVRVRKRLIIVAEIVPGYGWTTPFLADLRSPRQWFCLLRDICREKP